MSVISATLFVWLSSTGFRSFLHQDRFMAWSSFSLEGCQRTGRAQMDDERDPDD